MYGACMVLEEGCGGKRSRRDREEGRGMRDAGWWREEEDDDEGGCGKGGGL